MVASLNCCLSWGTSRFTVLVFLMFLLYIDELHKIITSNYLLTTLHFTKNKSPDEYVKFGS